MHVDPSDTPTGQLSIGNELQHFSMFGKRYFRQSVQQTQQLIAILKSPTGQLSDHKWMATNAAFVE